MSRGSREELTSALLTAMIDALTFLAQPSFSFFALLVRVHTPKRPLADSNPPREMR